MTGKLQLLRSETPKTDRPHLKERIDAYSRNATVGEKVVLEAAE